MKSTTQWRRFALIATVGLTGAFAACEAGGDDVLTNNNPDNPGNLDAETTTLAISFMPMGSTETRCGDAAGVHVQISDGLGDVQTCNAEWAPAELGGQPVGDCFFVVHPGVWRVDDVSIIDDAGQALTCCSGSWPETVSVSESSTTEFGAGFTCDTVSSGALDIFATMNRPPTINDIVISPSKFGNTCQLITFDALATDPDGDGVSYAFSVREGPVDADWAIATRGDVGYFLASGAGSYGLRLVVADDYGASHYLDFPVHLSGEVQCDADALLGELLSE